MHPPLLVVGHDELRLQATRDALHYGRLLNPVVECAGLEELTAYVQGQAPYDDRATHPLPAVVLTELHLDRGTAADVLRAVRNQLTLRRTPVIVVADEATEQEIDEVHRLGAAAFLDRGVAVDVLVGVIRDTDVPWAVGTHAALRQETRLQECVT